MNNNIEKAIYFSLGLVSLSATLSTFSQDILIKKCKIDTGKDDKYVRFAVVADLHATYYGNNQEILINKIFAAEPNAVLLAGDIFDELRRERAALLLLEAIGRKYPCFYVTGNHEYRIKKVEKIKRKISDCGITVLENGYSLFDVNGKKIGIYGIEDPKYFGRRAIGDKWTETLNYLSEKTDKNIPNILLSHRPEGACHYKKTNFDAVVCGHAHGGQVILPKMINGLYAPDQGVLPKYAGGMYVFKNNCMVVSRGLCKNLKPRLMNRPEIIIMDVK